MAFAPPRDEVRLQAFYERNTKYDPAPVPTPLDASAAMEFVEAKITLTLPPEKMRKLMKLVVFYDLHQAADLFSNMLQGGESQSADIYRSCFCLIALAWIGDPVRRSQAQQYYHALQDRANVELHRQILLEVVEAFGPREGTGSHRRWIQSAVATLEERLHREQAASNTAAATLAEEQINTLTEYLAIQLALADRAFTIRDRIEAMPPTAQIAPLSALSLATARGSTPQLSYWASMRILRLPAALRLQIAEEFYTAGVAQVTEPLLHARALRAAEFFGLQLPEPEAKWLAGQPDAGVDPLVLRPRYYPA
jgi:hypothetical protein